MYVNARAIIERQTLVGLEILIQVRHKAHEGRKYIELPGGQVEEYESLIDALIREVREETGLTLTHIEGTATRIEAHGPASTVECLQPFAVYQTTRGPVDSMGVYFRCTAEGELLQYGDDTEQIHWIPLQQLSDWLDQEPDRFSWVDRAGLIFYLQQYPPSIPSQPR